MPYYKTILLNKKTTILLWKITESFNDLYRAVSLKDVSLARLESMKSESHQKGFLAVRMLLQTAGYTDYDLYYDEFGKPHLKDGTHISISHSFEFSAIVLSDKNIGIDLELRREKVIKIAHKFCKEDFVINSQNQKEDTISKLTIVWGIKEAVFKVRNEIGISFLDHITVNPFEINDKIGACLLQFNDVNQEFEVYFEEIENYSLVCVWEK